MVSTFTKQKQLIGCWRCYLFMSYNFSSIVPVSHLSSSIKNFFTIEVSATTTHTDYLLPDGLPSFFYIETSEPVNTFFGKRMISLHDGFYVGYSNMAVELTHRQLKIVGASVYPVYFNIIFGKSPQDIINSFYRLENEEAFEGVKTLAADNRFTEIIAVYENYITKQIEKHPLSKDLLTIGEKVIRKDGQVLNVEELAAEMGYSTRYLHSRFKEFFGMSPKKFIKLIRFNQALKYIHSHGGDRKLSSIAQEAGYHDHSHFIRDFKAICGKTPKEIFSNNNSLADKFNMF